MPPFYIRPYPETPVLKFCRNQKFEVSGRLSKFFKKFKWIQILWFMVIYYYPLQEGGLEFGTTSFYLPEAENF
jgi:hypothetical protein